MREEKQQKDREQDRVVRRSGDKILADASNKRSTGHANGTSNRRVEEKETASRKKVGEERTSSARGAEQAEEKTRAEKNKSAKQKQRTSNGTRTAEKERIRVKETAASGSSGAQVFWQQVVPYAMFWLALFAAVSFVLRDLVGRDGSVGAFGEWLANVLCGIFGIGAYILPLFLIVLALKWRRLLEKGVLGKKIILSTFFILLLSGIIHVFLDADRAGVFTGAKILYYGGVARTGGGFFGGFIGEWLGFCFRLPGTCLLAIPLLVIIGINLLGFTPAELWQRIDIKLQMMRQRRRELRGARVARSISRTRQNDAEPTPEEGSEESLWKEPQPLTRTGVTIYDFHEDEPDVIVEPVVRRAHKRSNEPVHMQNAVQEPVRAPEVSVQRSANANEIVDIPDDEPTYPVSPAASYAPAATVQQPYTAQQTYTAQPPYAAQETHAAWQSAPATPTQAFGAAVTPAEPPKEEEPANYYAPFALPVRPEPKRERSAESVGAHIVITPHAVEERSAEDVTMAAAQRVARSVQVSDSFEDEGEVLGSTPPPRAAEALALTPETVEPPMQPYESKEPHKQIAALEDEGALGEETLGITSSRSEETVTLSSLLEFENDDAEEHEAQDTPASDMTSSAQDMRCAKEQETFSELTQENTVEANVESSDMAQDLTPAAKPLFEEEYPLPDDARKDEEDDPFFAPPVAVVREKVDPDVAAVPPAETVFTAPTPSRYEPPHAAPAVQKEPVRDEAPPAPEVVRKEYVRPPLTLLNEDKNVRNQDFYEEIEETKQILRDTLESFNIHIQDQVAYSHGPSVTRYELRPVAGTSVRSVTNRIEDISLNLASSVRIEAPIPGKPAIGIEVPNKVRETVYMRTMLESPQFKNSTEPLEVPIGLDVGGTVRMCNLAKMPHLLVAGTTGSGKSVCINSILVSLIYKTSPEDLRLILIDPKQIEFAPYEHVPHLYMPIVTDMQRAAGALACAVQEMERRFTLIRDVGVRNIEAYNEVTKNDPDREHLPYMIIVIDEFADLKMSCSNNDPENFTCRIAQKARAAGIHLIIGTQRPSVDVITGKLKTNIPSRIAFMVKQQVDSRTILDVNGAESLTGRGDMLYMPTTSQDKMPTRVQGAFVSDGELERVVSFVRRNNDPVQYNQAFMDQIEVEMAKAQNNGKKADFDDFGDDDESGEDPKFVEAVKLAIDTQKVATSLLQRRLGVGYGRAAKIIDRMEELGLVSAPDGNKPRQILPAAQGYLNHLAAVDEDDGDDFNDYGA